MPRPTFFNLPDHKRQRILDTAIDEFAGQGYSAASISSIVSRAGIAKGSFYQYFDGKVDLFRWLVLGEGARRKIQWMATLTRAEPGDFWSGMSAMMLGGIRFGLAHPKLARIAMDVWYAPADAELRVLHRELQDSSRANTRALLVQGQQAGQVRLDLDIDVATDLVLATLQQGLDLSLQRTLGADLLELCSAPPKAASFGEGAQVTLIDGIVDLLRRALGTGAPARAGGPAIDLDHLPNRPWEG